MSFRDSGERGFRRAIRGRPLVALLWFIVIALTAYICIRLVT